MPDGLAPGLALAGCAEDAHAGLAGLTDDELIGVLRAWARQELWAQARKLAAVAELARRRPADGTPPAPPGQFPATVSEFTADEVALALTLTRRSAGAQLDLALALAARPGVAALLEAGAIDLLRVRVIIDGITGLAGAHAAAVEAAVLPEAPGMTSGQLRAAVAQAVLAADPDAARRDREERVKDARVECWPDPTGTANLAGRDLPSAETLAADSGWARSPGHGRGSSPPPGSTPTRTVGWPARRPAPSATDTPLAPGPPPVPRPRSPRRRLDHHPDHRAHRPGPVPVGQSREIRTGSVSIMGSVLTHSGKG